MIPEETLSSIYIEASLFVLVILAMSIISYKISSKNAKEYAIKNKKNIDAKREAEAEVIKSKETRVEELQKMLDDDMITEEEFRMMRKRLYNTEEE